MAGSSDGAIIIDTELDSSGFDKGSEKLLSSIQQLTGAVDNVGDNMMNAFGQLIPILRDVASSTGGIYAAMAGEGQKAAEAAREVAGAEQAVAQEAQEMGSAASESGEAVTALKQEAEAVQTAANGAGDSLESSLSGTSESAGRLQGQLSTVNRQIAEMEAKIAEQEATKLPYVEQAEELRAKIKAAEAEAANYQKAWVNGTPGADTDQAASQAQANELRAEYEAVVAQIDKMDKALEKSDAKLERLKTKAGELAQRLEEANAASEGESEEAKEPKEPAAEKPSGGAEEITKSAEVANQKIVQLNAKMQELKAKIKELEGAGIGLGYTEYDQAIHELGRVNGALNEYKQKVTETRSFSERLSDAFGNAKNAAANFLKSGLERLKNGLQAVGSAVGSCVKRLAKMTFSKIAGGIKSAVGQLGNFAKQSRQTASTAKVLAKTMTSLKTMLISRVKRTFISYLMDEIKSAVGGLAQYSNAFDQSISGMRNATSELGANLAVSFSNLVNAVAPAITTIISYLSQAASYLSAFFGMLGGKSSVTVAKKQTDSYAESLNDATDSANALNKANHTLGIDELNVVSQDSGGSSSGKTGTDIYEEIPIDQLLPEDVSTWFDSIKTAFQNGDCEGIGGALTSGLSTAVSGVGTWIETTVAPKATEWSGRIAQLLNGAVSGLDWAGVGSLFGTGLNTVAATADTFLTTFDFQNLGSEIATAVNGLFDTVDWEGLGATFGHYWTALIDTVYGFVTTTDWESIGTSIAGFISGWFNGVDWLTLGTAVGIGISGVISTIHTVITETDWATMGGTLGGSVNALFDNIDWADIGSTVSDGFVGALTFLSETIKTLDWQQLGADVVEMLTSIDWSGCATALSDGIGAALGGLAGFIWGVISPAWDEVVGWWKENAFEDGKFTILGLLDGILEALANIGTWIVEHIFQPFINGFKEAFGIHSPSTVMAEQGNFLVEGLLEGIKGVWDSITEYFSTALTELKTAIGEKWDAMKTAASEKWTSIKTTVSTKFTELKTKLNTTGNLIKSTISGKWTDVKTTASTKWTDIKQTVSEKWDGLKTTLKETDWKEIGGNLVAGVKQGILDAWDTFKTFVTSKFSGIIDSVKGVFGIHSPSKVFAEIGEYLDEGLVVGVKAGEKSMLRSVKEMAGNVTQTMSDIDPEIEIAGNATLTGINNAAAALSGIADKFAAIAKVLADMGGLQVPTVATGAVVPYQARVSAASGGYAAGDIGAVITSGNAELTAILRELVQDVIQAIRDNTPQFRIGDEQVMRSYDRANESRGIRVNQGAFANAY